MDGELDAQFSASARRRLGAAETGSDVDLGHLIRTLERDGSSVTRNALHKSGLTADRIGGSPEISSPELLVDRGVLTMQCVREAILLGDQRVDDCHIVLALARLMEQHDLPTMAGWFEDLGADPATVRRHVTVGVSQARH